MATQHETNQQRKKLHHIEHAKKTWTRQTKTPRQSKQHRKYNKSWKQTKRNRQENTHRQHNNKQKQQHETTYRKKGQNKQNQKTTK